MEQVMIEVIDQRKFPAFGEINRSYEKLGICACIKPF